MTVVLLQVNATAVIETIIKVSNRPESSSGGTSSGRESGLRHSQLSLSEMNRTNYLCVISTFFVYSNSLPGFFQKLNTMRTLLITSNFIQ